MGLLRSLAFGCALSLLGFGQSAGAQDRNVTVFAAASLNEAMHDIAAAYETKTGVHVKASLAASSTLARQIEAGAEADVFFSADTEWMDYLADRGLVIAETRSNIVANHLVLIAPAGSPNPAKIEPNFPLATLLGAGRLSVADPDSVPAGKYARQSLTTLGVWGQVVDKLLRGDNVRVALSYVALGEAPYGIVYATDALAEPKVMVVGTFPDSSHLPIVYPAAVLKRANGDAALFVAYLHGPDAAAIFTRHGFMVPGKAAP